MIRAISASTYPKQALNQPFLIQKSQALREPLQEVGTAGLKEG